MSMEDRISQLEESFKKVVLPWVGISNYPFYVDIRKPRASHSKHDSDQPTYWNQDDGEYLLRCVNEMPEILQYIRDLERQLKNLKNQIVAWKDCVIHQCSSEICAVVGRKCNSWL